MKAIQKGSAITDHVEQGHEVFVEATMLGPTKKSLGGFEAILFAYAKWNTRTGKPRTSRFIEVVDGKRKRDVEEKVGRLVGLSGVTLLDNAQTDELLAAYNSGDLHAALERL